ncbi:MAG: hypothetical protein KDA85_21125, partial [Planctomycetaceae bacterium]|nr:hypothetical protein [Planctomycetaceae bacterium]
MSLPIDARLQTLDLGECKSLTKIPEGDYSELTHVWLNGCPGLKRFAPLRPALKRLQQLELHGCDFQDGPGADRCGLPDENVADRIRNHFQELTHQGCAPLLECKVIVLGNGGVGKTELVRALKGLGHDSEQKSTHGIRLWKWNGATDRVPFHPFPEITDTELQLNIWDFGGQDLYHNTHRLFMETQAVFVVVERYRRTDRPLRPEHPDDYCRPLDYWLDQVYTMAGRSGRTPRVLIVRSAIDETDNVEVLPPWQTRVRSDYCDLPYFELSSKDELRNTEFWTDFRKQLLQAVTDELGGLEAVQQPRGRVAVRSELQRFQPEWNELIRVSGSDRPLLRRHEFQKLVEDVFDGLKITGADDEEIRWQLDFFHHRGIVYAPPEWMEQSISRDAYPVVVDQRWIIEGIYELMRPERGTRDDLMQAWGRITRGELWQAWDQLEIEQPELKYDEEARCAMR